MILIAHIFGAPVEELLASLASGTTVAMTAGLLLGVGSIASRVRRQPRQ